MSTTRPNEAECLRILKEAGCSTRVMIHCCTVKTVAEAIMERIQCDRQLVVAGALLHDLGRSKDHSIMHAVVGASIARELGLPDDVIEIIRRHTGAGLDTEDVEAMGLPPGDYIPETIEQKIVAHADNMVSDDTVVSHERSVDKLRAKGHYRGALRIAALHMELSQLYGEDLDSLLTKIGEHPAMNGPCSKKILG